MPRRARVAWDSIADAAPGGVLSLHELTQLGVPGRTISSRCAQRGPWTRLLPGVVMLHSGTPTRSQLLDAALRYAGTDAMLTGVAAARLYGLRRLPNIDDIHVLVSDRRQRLSVRPVVVERTTRLPDPRQCADFPVAPISRAVLDAARRTRNVDQVRAMLAEALQRGMTTTSELHRELDAGSDRGSALPRFVLRELRDGVRSPAEAWARSLIASSRIPTPRWNIRIYTESGLFLAMPDAWFDDVALAWEIDSYDFHLSPADYARTLARHAAMTAEEIIVVHTLPSRIHTEPRVVLAELEATYDQARCRPRPPLRADLQRT